MEKKQVVAILDEMGTLLELQGANPFKSRAFHTASRALEGVTGDLRALAESGGLLEVKGIGKSIAQIISDLVTTGRSGDYDELREQFPPGVLEMLRIQGLGPKKVKILFEKVKLTSLAELEEAARAGRLESLEGFGKKTEENILSGIEALRRRSDKVLYPLAFEPAREFVEYMRGQKGVIRCEMAGSLRRHKETIGDIDLLVSAKDSDRTRLMNAFTSWKGVESVVAHGETKSTVLLGGGISCDLRIVRDSEFPFALNYFTGSKEHNVTMRTRAKRFGWSLNEYGFSRLGEEEKRGKAKRSSRAPGERRGIRSGRAGKAPPSRGGEGYPRDVPLSHHRQRRRQHAPPDGGRRPGARVGVPGDCRSQQSGGLCRGAERSQAEGPVPRNRRAQHIGEGLHAVQRDGV